MTDRTVRVVLTAATQQFDAAMRKAQASAQGLQTNMGKLAESARHQSDAWNTVGSSLAGIGAAVTGINVAVAKTGIEYNTLQQTSRAALTTMLGSAEAVNAQMDKLDEFARTSPFSKATFITAQQQMLAFGIEAEKVVPYLSAINDATAAAGGNNQTLAELAFIMAQIGAAGKITAQDLMQFGQRGVNAAELIGSQMGKTGAQIRTDISAGALDAGDALDALAAGMSERFEGASANVKDTMAGAFDRVKAAFRDLSADMMSSAVSPDGGGFLVDMTNSLADLLRAIEKLPQPVKEAAGALSGITGAAALAGGAVTMAVPKIVEAHAAWKTLGTTLPGVARVLGSLGPAAAAAGIAVAAIGTFIRPTLEWHARAREVVEEYSTALAENTDLLADNAAATDESIRMIVAKRLQDEGLLDMASTLGASLSDVTSAVLGEAEALERVQSAAQAHVDGIEALIAAKKAEQDVLTAGGVMTEEQAIRYNNLGIELEELGRQASDATGMQRQLLYAVGDEESRFQKGVEGARELKEEQEQVAEAAAAAIDPTQQLADAVGAAGDAADGAAPSIDDLTLSQEAGVEAVKAAEQEWVKYLNTLASGSQSFTSLGKALDAAQAKHRETAESMAAATKSGEASWEDFYDGTSVSIGQYLAELEKQIEAQNNWEANLLELSGRASQGLIDHLAEMGAEGAPLVAALVDATDEELARMERNFREAGMDASMGFVETLAEGAPAWAALGQKMGWDVVREAAREVTEGGATLQDIIDRYDLQATIDANADPAIRAAEAAMDRISRMTATMDVTSRIRAHHANGLHAPAWTGGRVGDVAAAYGLAGGGYSGYVRGPGTTTSDEAVAVNLSRDEFVIRAWAASRIGAANLYHMNRTGQLPQRPQNIIHRTSTATASTVNNNHEAPQITLTPGAIQIHGLSAVHAVEELQRELAGRFEQTGGRHG